MRKRNNNLPINQIICGDCVNEIQRWKTNCIDLTITSPPYDNLRDYQGYIFEFEKIAQQLYRVTKQGGIVVWVVGDATIKGDETGTSFKQALYFKEIVFNLHDTMIYEKSSFNNPSSNRYHQIFEYMFIFSKGKLKTFNGLKDRANKYSRLGGDYTRNKKGEKIKGKNTGKKLNPFGLRFNIWRYVVGGGHVTKDKIAYEHPAIFPEKLAADHILSWSNEGNIILDPMCGSGTTCKEAKKLNRKYIGIDISEEYCEISRKRIML